MVDAIGWASSFVLLLTIGKQVVKQWKERHTGQAGQAGGVSKWLFLGQIAASAGFVVYSALLQNWVFVVTNALLLVAAVFGAVTRARQDQSSERTAPVSTHSSESTASSSAARSDGQAIVRSPPLSANT